MGSSSDLFVICVILLIAIDISAGMVAGTSSASASCSVVSVGNCWTNIGYPAAAGTYVYTYSIPVIGGGYSIDLTPIVNLALWFEGLFSLIGSIFVVYVTFPNVFGGFISVLQILLEAFLVRGLLW